MANLISKSSDVGLTAANGFATVEAGTGAIQQTRSAQTNTTTSYVYSSAFTGTNTKVCDGLLLFCLRNNTTGTVDVALSDDNGTTATRSVSVNASDLPVNAGWVFFKFGSTLTLDGGTDYKVGVKASVSNNATFFRNATAGNWTRLLRLTTTATAAAGDVMYIVGDLTAAGTLATRTYTMDSTASTDYGTGSDGTADNGIEIGNGGVLTYGTTASTNYYLKLSGSLNVWEGGTLNIGTTGSPIPRTSTAVLEFDPVADGGMGLIINKASTVNIQGLSRTSGKNIFYCKLNTDEAANSTSLGVDTDTGWLDNDQIVVASTTRTPTQTELGAMNGNANAADLTVDGFAGAGGGLANAHSGTSPTQGEIINITRNVKIRSATSTIMAYVFCDTTSTVDIDWAEFYYLGENATNKRGIEIATTTGSFSMQYSSIHDTEDGGIYITGGSANNITFSNNVTYNLNTVAGAGAPGGGFMVSAATSGTSITIDTCLFLASRMAANSSGVNAAVYLADLGLTFTNCTVAGANGAGSGAITMSEAGVATTTFSGITSHSNTPKGINASSANVFFNFTNLTLWRNGAAGLDNTANATGYQYWNIDTARIFGNTTQNIYIGVNGSNSNGVLKMKTFTVDSDASFSTATGVRVDGSGHTLFITDSTFGNTTAHTSGDINLASLSGQNNYAYLFNTILASSTEVQNQTTFFGPGAKVASQKHDQSSTTYKSFYRFGTIQSDQTTRHTASGYSWKMTPAIAGFKLLLPGPLTLDTFKVAVNASSLVTITAYVQKDGSYNGNAPRLVMVGGIIGGIASDVTASLTVASGNWEQLSVSGTPNEAGVIEYYFDCDGTAGNVYIDDIAITQA